MKVFDAARTDFFGICFEGLYAGGRNNLTIWNELENSTLEIELPNEWGYTRAILMNTKNREIIFADREIWKLQWSNESGYLNSNWTLMIGIVSTGPIFLDQLDGKLFFTFNAMLMVWNPENNQTQRISSSSINSFQFSMDHVTRTLYINGETDWGSHSSSRAVIGIPLYNCSLNSTEIFAMNAFKSAFDPHVNFTFENPCCKRKEKNIY